MRSMVALGLMCQCLEFMCKFHQVGLDLVIQKDIRGVFAFVYECAYAWPVCIDEEIDAPAIGQDGTVGVV